MHSLKIIGVLLLLALVAVFTFQNTETAQVHILFWSWQAYVSLMLLTALFTGVLIGLILSYVHGWRKKRIEKNAAPAGSSYAEERQPRTF